MATFQLFFQSGRAKDLSAPLCTNPEQLPKLGRWPTSPVSYNIDQQNVHLLNLILTKVNFVGQHYMIILQCMVQIT